MYHFGKLEIAQRFGYYRYADGLYVQVDFTTEFNSPKEFNGRSYDRTAFKAKAVDPKKPDAVETIDVVDEDFVPFQRGEDAPLRSIRRKDIPADILWAFPNKAERKTVAA